MSSSRRVVPCCFNWNRREMCQLGPH
jgi:hypothetical protein